MTNDIPAIHVLKLLSKSWTEYEGTQHFPYYYIPFKQTNKKHFKDENIYKCNAKFYIQYIYQFGKVLKKMERTALY